MKKNIKVKKSENKIVSKITKRKTLKPNDSSWIVWMVATLILVGVFVAQFLWGCAFTDTIIWVYTPLWGIISILYMVGRVARKKLDIDSLLKLADKIGGTLGESVASFVMHNKETSNVEEDN